jgi:hypothetical protein
VRRRGVGGQADLRDRKVRDRRCWLRNPPALGLPGAVNVRRAQGLPTCRRRAVGAREEREAKNGLHRCSDAHQEAEAEKRGRVHETQPQDEHVKQKAGDTLAPHSGRGETGGGAGGWGATQRYTEVHRGKGKTFGVSL